MSIDNVRDKLIASESFKSLSAERAVADELKTLLWTASHGTYYVDSVTAKTREIDVLASQRWLFAPKGALLLNMVVECKSMNGFHLVVSEAISPFPHTLPNWWVGDEAVSLKIFESALSSGIATASLTSLRQGFVEAIFGTTRGFADHLLSAPPTAFSGSAFKESAITTEKDLDNSVLWRATQAVTAAVTAFVDQETRERVIDLSFAAQVEVLNGAIAEETLIQEMADLLTYREYYHPVVVTNALLWAYSDGRLKNVNCFRLEVRDKDHSASTWVDVVYAPHAPAFFRTATKYYARVLRKQGASRE